MTVTHKLIGGSMQMVACQLAQGQSVFCEPGKFLWKTTNVDVRTTLGAPSGDGGGRPQSAASSLLGLAKNVGKRMLAGESLAVQVYSATRDAGLVAFAGVLPGQIRALELDGTTQWLAQKDAFVAAESTIDFDIAFSGGKTGRWGGEGFILEKLGGTGTVFIAGAGDFVDLNPADYGGRIQVDTGCIVAFESSVKYGVERVGGLDMQGVMNMALGGEGVHLATLEGDGRVIIQSMTTAGIAQALMKNVGPDEDRKGFTGGLFSGSMD